MRELGADEDVFGRPQGVRARTFVELVVKVVEPVDDRVRRRRGLHPSSLGDGDAGRVAPRNDPDSRPGGAFEGPLLGALQKEVLGDPGEEIGRLQAPVHRHVSISS